MIHEKLPTRRRDRQDDETELVDLDTEVEDEDEPDAEPVPVAPVAPLTAAEKIARATALVQKADKRTEHRNETADEDEIDSDLITFSERATLRLAEEFAIGEKNAVVIRLKAPVIAVSARIRQEIFKHYPDVFIAAASVDRFGRGVDLKSCADFWKLIQENRNAEIKSINTRLKAQAQASGITDWQPIELIPMETEEQLREEVLR